MKINKIIFSCSEPPAYSSYWNMHSKLWKVGFGIEPICLLFGKKANTDMSEEYGKVIEREIIPDLPWAIQMTWSKFDFPRTEPDTTWMIGDIDLLPLQKQHFDKVSAVPDDHYACLNGSGIGIPRCGRVDAFEALGSQRHGKDGGFIGCDIPAHYHVAKGRTFQKLYYGDRSFEDTVRHIVNSDRYGLGVMDNYPKENIKTQTYWYYWCAEENYSSERLYNAMRAREVVYHNIPYSNKNERIWVWNKERRDYEYDPTRVHNKQIVDIHCCQVRPYADQAVALERLVELSGLLR